MNRSAFLSYHPGDLPSCPLAWPKTHWSRWLSSPFSVRSSPVYRVEHGRVLGASKKSPQRIWYKRVLRLRVVFKSRSQMSLTAAGTLHWPVHSRGWSHLRLVHPIYCVHSLCLQRWFGRAAEGSRVVTLDNSVLAGRSACRFWQVQKSVAFLCVTGILPHCLHHIKYSIRYEASYGYYRRYVYRAHYDIR